MAQITYNIIDSTKPDIGDKARAFLQAMAAGAPPGVVTINLNAGSGSGHKSHQETTHNQIDVVGFHADGTPWTKAERAATAGAARAAGADRFGLYSGPTLHVGASGGLIRNRLGQMVPLAAGVWDDSTNFVKSFPDRSDQAFLASYQSGKPPQVNIATAGPPSATPAAPAGGGFLQTLLGRESFGGQNVSNVDATTSSGRARGYFQITDGTWKDFAPKAGVDLAQYPSALSAPYDVQAQVASSIPMGRWDPKTIGALQAAGYKVDLSATLGQNVAANGGAPSEAIAYSPDKLASGQAAISDWMGTPAAPPSIATVAPVVADVMTPPALGDIPASPTGADAVVRASMEGDPAHLTSAWNQLVTNVMAGGEKARSAASDYIARSPIPTKLAMASAFAWNPDLWKSVPALGFPGQPTVRDTARLASEDLMTGGHAADQMRQFGIGPSAGELSTPIYSDTRASVAPAEQPTVYESSRIASPAMGSPARDPLQQVTSDYKGYIPGGMATTAPPTVKPDGGPGLDESMSYAMGDIIGSPTNMPTVAPAAPALSYVPQKVAAPSVAPAPTRGNIATVGPTQKPTMLNRVFGMPGMQTYNDASSVAQSVIAAAHAAGLGVSPFTPSGAGWHAPNFSSGSGGANFAYKPNGQGGGTYVNSYGQTMTY